MLDHRLPYRSLYRGFQAMAERWPDRIVIKDHGKDTTYAALEQQSRRAARALIAVGLQPGDRVAIWAVNHSEWVVAGLAIQAAGGVIIPVSTRLRSREIGEILRRASASILMCDPGFGDYDFVAGVEKEPLPELRQIVRFGDGPAQGRVLGWHGFLAAADSIPDEAVNHRIAETARETLADIIFTSGTTGTPKGVPMTHGQSLIACEQQQLCCSRFEEGDLVAVTYPFAHNAGYRAGWQACLQFGVPFIPVRDYDPLHLLGLIDRQGVTVLPAVPTIFRGILDHPQRVGFVLSSVRRAMTGATTIPVALIQRMQAEFGIDSVVTGYGLTETAGSVSSTRPCDSAEVIATTTGKPLDNLQVKLIDAEGKEVQEGTAGEIVVRGPQVMRAYYKDDVTTAAAFTGDGFLRTGDVGVFDEAGNLRITDRIKDMYIVGGFNTYPAEVEQQLSRIEGVAEAAVIGIADERLGQVGRAFIICRPGASVDEAAVIAWCRENMANYKVPRVVTFVDSLPRTGSGKVSKVELRELA